MSRILPRPPLGRRRSPVLTAAALVAMAACGPGAAPAGAASFEQIDRANGPAGFSPLFGLTQPLGASDTGRYGLLQGYSTSDFKAFFGLRDVVSNLSGFVAQPAGFREFGFDKAEKVAVVIRDPTDGQGGTDVLLVPANGAAPKIVTHLDESLASASTYAAISGDGKTVVVSTNSYTGADETRVFRVDTGQVKQLFPGGLRLGPRSVSDDGKVIIGDNYANTYLFRGGTQTQVHARSVVSPDGSSIAWLDQPTGTISVQKLATGVVKTVPLPNPGYLGIAWIAGDSSKIAVPTTNDSAEPSLLPAKLLDVASGTWTTFGGPYALSLLQADISEPEYTGGNIISRNGRYAVLSYTPLFGANHAALVRLSPGNLPGAQEPLSASSYVGVSKPGRACQPEDPTNPQPAPSISVRFAQPASWAPIPRSATVTLAFDQGGTVTRSFASASPPVGPDSGVQVAIPAAATKVTVSARVIDGSGRVLTTSDAAPIGCSSFPF